MTVPDLQLASEYSSIPVNPPCTTCYLSYDHLGSVRLVTDQNGNVVARHGFLPFGQEIPANTVGRNGKWGLTTDAEQKFTGQIRDTETGIDYFQARYFTNALGRFNSPDPANAGADMTDPQTWNAYAYVRNNPLTLTDPSGLDRSNCGGVMADACVAAPEPPPVPLYWYFMSQQDQYYAWLQSQWSHSSSGGGGGEPPNQPENPGTTQQSTQRSTGLFTCASEFASKYSIAGALQHFGIGRSGVSGFITNALGGNVFSGATDLIQSFRTGSGGGHNVFYNMAQGVAAGPALGFGAAFGKHLEGTPWTSGPAEVTTRVLVGRGFSLATGAGRTIQALNGVAELSSLGVDAADFATGVGLAKIVYDGLTYFGGAAGCALGVIR